MINDKITTLAVSRPKLPETYIDIYIRAFVSMTFKLLAMGHQTSIIIVILLRTTQVMSTCQHQHPNLLFYINLWPNLYREPLSEQESKKDFKFMRIYLLL